MKPVIVSIFFLILLSGGANAAQISDHDWRGINQPTAVIGQIQNIGSHLKQQQATGNRRGTKVLFAGPSSTGKTMAAQLLANHMGQTLYKLDLASVVSKYIGETEKNLDLLFARAESGNWILFFDDADALLGGRTNIQDSHDKYSNQTVSYLLQRMETFSGLIIITSNNPATKNRIRHDHAIEFTAVNKPAWPPITPR